jgi:signal transduction histidine kinase
VTGLGKLFRTTAFKLSAAYLLVFVLFAGSILGYVAWNARRVLDDQIQGTIDAELQGLAEQYRIGGIRRLVNNIDRRSRAPSASLYLVTTVTGEPLAGNVVDVPFDVLDEPGSREIAYRRSDEAGDREFRALVRVYVLPGGFRLLVGRDVEERLQLQAVIRRALALSIGLVTVLACLGGWFITRRVLKRVDEMTETTRTIMEGDLDGRLAVTGTGDELDRLARNLNDMLSRIGELMAGMREVSDNIAHDLKTPLTRLRNRAEEALRAAKSPDEYAAALEGIIDESDNLIRIFNALLMIARLEAGNATPSMGDFDAAEIAGSLAELYEPLAEEAGMPLVADIEPNLPVHGNRELISQALANLMDNALKYGTSCETTPEVRIRARRVGDMVEIAVSDRGPGIPEGERERVLERFARLESARSKPGFGLGLSLASAVARLHAGALRLEDNGPGLRAVLALPLAKGGIKAGHVGAEAALARPSL